MPKEKIFSIAGNQTQKSDSNKKTKLIRVVNWFGINLDIKKKT